MQKIRSSGVLGNFIKPMGRVGITRRCCWDVVCSALTAIQLGILDRSFGDYVGMAFTLRPRLSEPDLPARIDRIRPHVQVLKEVFDA